MRIENERKSLGAALTLLLNKEEVEKVQELISLGMSRDDAILSARSEKATKKSKELKNIEDNLSLKKSDMKNKLKIKLDYDFEDLKQLEKHARKTLEDGLQEHRQKEKKRLFDHIEKRRLEKEAELISSGTNVKKAKEITSAEAQKEILKMESQLENELERAMRLIRDAQKLAYDIRITDMKAENEKKTKGLEAYLNFRKIEAERKLTEKLSKLKVTRERQLTASGLSNEEANLIAEKEYGLNSKEFQDGMKNISDMLLKDGAILRQIALEGLKREKEAVTRKQAENAEIDDKESLQLLDDLLKKERETLLENYNTSKSIFEAARDASRYSQKDATKDLKNYREEYERELKRLDSELLLKKEKEEKALRNRLLLIKKNRILELVKSGMTEIEAEKIAEEERTDKYRTELEDIYMRLNLEYQDVSTIRLKSLSDQERIAIDQEHKDAIAALEEASENKNLAQRKLDEMKKEQEEERIKFEELMKHSRMLREEVLKTRLKEKKEKKMKKLLARNSTEKEKQEEIDKINQEEYESISKLKSESEEEDNLKRIELRKKCEQDIIDANNSVTQAELEAAVAKAKESAIVTVRNAKMKADADLHTKEIQRMKDQHARLEEAASRELENAQAQGKGKLKDRLNAKKLRKEVELVAKEEKERSDLLIKQEKEEEEREKLRKSKINWMDKLQSCFETIEKTKMNNQESEDFCMQELLVKEENLVPITQLNEVIGKIQGKRHQEEMLHLLNSHFDERLLAIKTGIEIVLDEKSVARTELLQRISNENLDDKKSKELTLELEKNFNKKQFEIETKTIGRLEPLHIKQQMDLRQKQLENIAQVVTLYATPESLAELQELRGGKSQVEEMAAYRLRLENDKKLREENSIIERNQNEMKLREEMAEELIVMQKQFKEVQKLAEKEFDDKKLELLKQREELELKQSNEKGLLNEQEKNRILTEFEKEKKVSLENLENSKKNQKSKLNERLATKRRSKASLFDGNVIPEMFLPSNTESQSMASSNSNVPEGFPVSNINKLTIEISDDNNVYEVTNTKDLLTDKDERERNNSTKILKNNGKKNIPDTLDKITLASMKMIESKLEHIERMIVAIEVKAAVVDTLSSPRGAGSPRKLQHSGFNTADANMFNNNNYNNNNNSNNNFNNNSSNNFNNNNNNNNNNSYYNNDNNNSNKAIHHLNTGDDFNLQGNFNDSNNNYSFHNMSNITTGTIPPNFNITNENNGNYNNNSNKNNYKNQGRNNGQNKNENFDISNTPVFKDLTEPQSGMEIQILPEKDMTPQDKVRVEYGLKLSTMIGLPDLKIVIAVELPISKINNNSFSNSYYYDDIENKLYVHSNRLVSSGDFGLVVIHALSHIKVRNVMKKIDRERERERERESKIGRERERQRERERERQERQRERESKIGR